MKKICFALLILLFTGNFAKGQVGLTAGGHGLSSDFKNFYKVGYSFGAQYNTLDDSFDYISYRYGLSYGKHNTIYDTIPLFYVEGLNQLKEGFVYYGTMHTLRSNIGVEIHPLPKSFVSPYLSLEGLIIISYYDYSFRNADQNYGSRNSDPAAGISLKIGGRLRVGDIFYFAESGVDMYMRETGKIFTTQIGLTYDY